MSTSIALLILVIVALAAAVVWLLISQQRSKRLRSKFGPEYHRTVTEMGGRAKAERELDRREKRIQQLNIRPLPPAMRDRYLEAWRTDQGRFVDDPKGAVMEADRLVQSVMRERGYPVADFEQRVDDISVDHPHLVSSYRAARNIMMQYERGQATTEELRQALVHYRALFEELLEMQGSGVR